MASVSMLEMKSMPREAALGLLAMLLKRARTSLASEPGVGVGVGVAATAAGVPAETETALAPRERVARTERVERMVGCMFGVLGG